jgi:large subunit ribosomal protein L10
MTLGSRDPQEISKAIVEFAKTNQRFVPRGVVFEGKAYGADFVKSLSKLPSRRELLTQVVVRIKSPISGVVLTLGQLMRGLVCALNEIKNKKSVATAA